MLAEEAIQEYQCSGCVSGEYPDCYVKGMNVECTKHCSGTRIMPIIGRIFLGLPRGFSRLGPAEETKISIFKEFEDGWGYDTFNVPVWKHLDKHGNTLVRGICPRLNLPWVHIFLGNVLNRIDCINITNEDLEGMD